MNTPADSPPRPRSFHRRILLAVLLLLFLAQGAVLSLILLFHQAREEMKAMHEESLSHAALAAALALAAADLLDRLAADENARLEAELRLAFVREETRVENIELYDPDGNYLLGLKATDARERLFHQAELWSAEAGTPAYTPPQQVRGLYFQTLYHPVRDPLSDEILAIVAVQADVGFLHTLAPLRRWATVLGVANALAAVLVAALFYFLQRRLAQLEARRAEADRLSAIGRLAAGVAHELRNPLAIIGQAVSLLRKKYDPAGADKFFDYIPAEVARMNGLVKEFLALARPQPLSLSNSSLAEVAERVHAQFTAECQRRGVAFTHETAGPSPCRLDPDRMVQVGLNLVSNALDAMPHGGKLVSRTGARAREVFWSLSDSGPGIPPEQLPRLTEAFYTTKPEGTGLGLAVVERIVSRHGGRLEITSPLGEGATFTIYLPRGT